MPARRTVLDDPPFALARASFAFRRLGEQSSREAGLPSQPPGMPSVLHALYEAGECTVRSLVEKTQLPNGTLTGLLDALEREGYLQRIDNPDDGRSWILRLTTEGHQLCAKLQQRHRRVMSVFGEALSAPEAAELTRLLGKLTDHLRTYAAERDASSPGRPQPTSTEAGERRRNKTRPHSGRPPRGERLRAM